jgi:hypothetical protein
MIMYPKRNTRRTPDPAAPSPATPAPAMPALARTALVERARQRLASSAYPALRKLDCYYHEGVLTIRGRVSTFHERQLAWITLCDLAGIEEFVDRIEVVEQS